ncbi:peroxide stress protein YaaA [Tateyamaria sp.]|uniref:peroxide stress protein YaaA n=1 Tax=Tateyamaria sp. TaxID=1929288 RepID=UPI00329E0C34
MLVVISPAKRLDWAERDVATTEPMMQDDAVRLVRTARNLTLGNLKTLMSLSDDLARLNRDRFAAFEDAPDAGLTRPAMLAFAGDTYQGLRAESLSADDTVYAQDHLRILSGLYGVLRPLDAIQPYRLEMGSRLKTRRGVSLYEYWRDDIAKALNAQAETTGTNMLVNCASQEYFGAVPLKALKPQVITPVFMEDKGAGPKIVSFFAKRARGAMARHIVQNQVQNLDGVRAFETDGYQFQPEASDETRLVFVRPYPA